VVLAPAIRPGVARPAVPRGAVVGDSRVATLQVAPSGTGRGAARETSGKPRTRATPLVPVAVAALVVSVVASGGEYVWARKSGAA
jgi:hypothetical protein